MCLPLVGLRGRWGGVGGTASHTNHHRDNPRRCTREARGLRARPPAGGPPHPQKHLPPATNPPNRANRVHVCCNERCRRPRHHLRADEVPAGLCKCPVAVHCPRWRRRWRQQQQLRGLACGDERWLHCAEGAGEQRVDGFFQGFCSVCFWDRFLRSRLRWSYMGPCTPVQHCKRCGALVTKSTAS